jgi:hypothetical protein
MVRTQIQLTEEELVALKELATERGTSMAALVRQAVGLLLRSRREVSRQEVRRRAAAFAGCLHSPEGDASRRHDDYLAEAYDS